MEDHLNGYLLQKADMKLTTVFTPSFRLRVVGLAVVGQIDGLR